MKRIDNLYQNIYDFNNILKTYNEVCRNTRNKQRVAKFKEYRCIYLARTYSTLKSKNYIPGKYNVFTIYEPKERRIVSQTMQDKVVNHLISRNILYPAILPCLLNVNVASRKGLGTSSGLHQLYNFRRICKIKYGEYYVLKCDIKQFFASINHDILKCKLNKRIKDKDALKIVFDIIDMEQTGLSIGAMTSQVLAIFYLNNMDHFIKEKLHIKYYIRYQDDFLLFHQSKKYLKFCLEEIQRFLKKEKLELNKKTRIYKSTNNFTFLGRTSNGHYAKYRAVNRKLRKRAYLYKNKKLKLCGLVNSMICYKHLKKVSKC